MTVRTNVVGATDYVLQEALGAYSDEAYTEAKKLSGTGIAGAEAQIDTSSETSHIRVIITAVENDKICHLKHFHK